MRNLSWYKGKKKILDGVSYKIGHNEKNFILKINKLSLEDAGDYVCSGFETVTGSRFSSTVHLDVTDSGKLSKYFFLNYGIDMQIRYLVLECCSAY